MAGVFDFAEVTHIRPLLAPIDTTTSDVNSAWVNLTKEIKPCIAVYFGAINDCGGVMRIHATTATDGTTTATDEPVSFWYRLSGAAATDTWGSPTSCDSGGITVTSAHAGMMFLLYPDASSILSMNDGDCKFCYLYYDAGSSNNTSNPIAAWLMSVPRYAQANIPTSS